ncbi:MAG TPA: hypothetical protein VGC66_24150 [Pyrinomonadaceae bacterium]
MRRRRGQRNLTTHSTRRLDNIPFIVILSHNIEGFMRVPCDSVVRLL